MKGICFSCAATRRASVKQNLNPHEVCNSMQKIERRPLFDLGQLVATPGALAALEKSGQSPMEFLTRHVTGDWGAVPEEDRKENQFSLEKGFRLLSSYRTTFPGCRGGAEAP
jgi:hypothetical protein